MRITEQLESALDDFVRASDAAKESPSDQQMARRVIEQSTLVAELAKREGFGGGPTTDESESVSRT